jgi:hypothetical protein
VPDAPGSVYSGVSSPGRMSEPARPPGPACACLPEHLSAWAPGRGRQRCRVSPCMPCIALPDVSSPPYFAALRPPAWRADARPSAAELRAPGPCLGGATALARRWQRRCLHARCPLPSRRRAVHHVLRQPAGALLGAGGPAAAGGEAGRAAAADGVAAAAHRKGGGHAGGGGGEGGEGAMVCRPQCAGAVLLWAAAEAAAAAAFSHLGGLLQAPARAHIACAQAPLLHCVPGRVEEALATCCPASQP